MGPEPAVPLAGVVVTHRAHPPLRREGGTTFHFVTDGLASAMEQAKKAAGGKEVEVTGGADVVQQCLVAGLLDELHVHVTPVLLGGGVRLFDRPDLAGIRLTPTRTVAAPGVTHLTHAVEHPAA